MLHDTDQHSVDNGDLRLRRLLVQQVEQHHLRKGHPPHQIGSDVSAANKNLIDVRIAKSGDRFCSLDHVSHRFQTSRKIANWRSDRLRVVNEFRFIFFPRKRAMRHELNLYGHQELRANELSYPIGQTCRRRIQSLIEFNS